MAGPSVSPKEATPERALPPATRRLMALFPELDFFVHEVGVGAGVSEVAAFCAFAGADVLVSGSGGLSRSAALLARGVVLAPAARGFPLSVTTLYGRRKKRREPRDNETRGRGARKEEEAAAAAVREDRSKVRAAESSSYSKAACSQDSWWNCDE